MDPAKPVDPSHGLLQVILDQAREIAALKAEVAERREQYRTLIQRNPYPTWIYCFDTLRFLDVNDIAVDTYGWSRDDFLTMTVADIRPPEDVPALVADVARMRAIPSGSGGGWRHLHKDGTVVQTLISFQTIPFAGRSARLIVANDSARARRATPGRRAATEAETLKHLSRRERQVLCLVARGHTSEEIAAQLALSRKSVETYRARFMGKLALANRADIVRFALEYHVLTREPGG